MHLNFRHNPNNDKNIAKQNIIAKIEPLKSGLAKYSAKAKTIKQ